MEPQTDSPQTSQDQPQDKPLAPITDALKSGKNEILPAVLFSVIITAILVGSGVYFWQRSIIKQLERDAKYPHLEEQLLEQLTPTTTPTPTHETELLEKGINPDQVEMSLIVTSNEWKNDYLKFELQRVYLTPDIADLGQYRTNNSVAGKGFLVAQVMVTNEKTDVNVGGSLVSAANYFRLQDENDRTGAPDTDLTGKVNVLPQESKLTYVIFPV
ncbi:hypothetical protein KKB40_05050, partial [Patescibacteria group bacterium]|nr:hypothetical protein [Patescibacteria group bacterium]